MTMKRNKTSLDKISHPGKRTFCYVLSNSSAPDSTRHDRDDTQRDMI